MFYIKLKLKHTATYIYIIVYKNDSKTKVSISNRIKAILDRLELLFEVNKTSSPLRFTYQKCTPEEEALRRILSVLLECKISS